MPLAVLLVDDHSVVREGYRRLLERDATFAIVAEAGTADAAYLSFRERQPDVVVLDISLPGASGLDAMQRMLAWKPPTRFLVCSMHEDPMFVERALEVGAHGYVSKAVASDFLSTAICAVWRGERYISPDLEPALARWRARTSACKPQLNAREIEILRMLVRGDMLEQIAATLRISEKTVSNYQSQLRQKLGARNATQLVRAAERLGVGGGTPPPGANEPPP